MARAVVKTSMMYTYIMQRTQISLTDEERHILDTASARSGKSMAALIRHAVEAVYGSGQSPEDDLGAMRRAFGAWAGRDVAGADYVERLRSGRRLVARD